MEGKHITSLQDLGPTLQERGIILPADGGVDRVGEDAAKPASPSQKESQETVAEAEEEPGIGLVPVPELPELEGLTADKAVGESVRKGAEEIRKWMVVNLPILEGISRADREVQEANAEKVAEARARIRHYLRNEPLQSYKRAAWLGLLVFELSRDLKTQAQVQDLLTRLVDEGRLQEIEGKGHLVAVGKSYVFSSTPEFGSPEVRELQKLFLQLLNRVWYAEKEEKIKASQPLFSRSELSLRQFLSEDPNELGPFALGIPPEPKVNDAGDPVIGRDGKQEWRNGGALLVKIAFDGDEKIVVPLAAQGNIHASVEEAMSLGVAIPHKAILQTDPSFIGKLPWNKRPKAKFLYHALLRGIEAGMVSEQRQAVKEGMAPRATTTSKAFFLEGELGVCLAEFSGLWEERSPEEVISRIRDLFFLVTRYTQEGEEEEERQTFISLVDVPEHVAEYLEECMGDYREGKQFEDVPAPLGSILRAIYGQVDKDAEIARMVNGGNVT